MHRAYQVYREVESETPQSLPIHASVGSVAKRMLDVVIAGIALTLGLPLALGVALVVAASSRGPVLFRQERVGLNGRRFTLWKFRTMHASSTDGLHRDYVLSMIRSTPTTVASNGVFKLQGDARVTRVGAFLRKTSLDEFPQFINALRGEMSVVGPRPALAYEVKEYAPWQLERLQVRPGITGWWQISGRNRMSYIEMCERDIEYVRGWSLLWDLRIMLRTPWVMITNSGRAG
jgi:lipopolysaccharide/colanic/teichoic acid biosynthesis glycosyltransferase